MTPEDLTDDAKVILLLCGHFGKSTGPEDGQAPLGTTEYARFSTFLHDKRLRPASLLEGHILDELQTAMSPVDIPRVRSLLARGAAMSFAVEGWMNKGLWLLCRSDEAYPRRLKRQLRTMAPPILFGAGDLSLLDLGGLAVVGSRNVGPTEEAFASQVAHRCAADGVQVVSGGARGVDQVAMREALEAGGIVIGVLADTLLKKSLQKAHREAIHDRRLVLLSPFHPEAGFNVGAAMGRNKLIYALADHALVVQAEFQKGGTWSGAVEELERPGGHPVFLNPGISPVKVIAALEAKGALKFPELAGGVSLDAQLRQAVEASRPPASPGHWVAGELQLREEPVQPDSGPLPQPSQPTVKTADREAPFPPGSPATIFEAVWPILKAHLGNPVTPADLAAEVKVRKAQAEDWLKQALNARLVRKLSRPVRYTLEDGATLDLK